MIKLFVLIVALSGIICEPETVRENSFDYFNCVGNEDIKMNLSNFSVDEIVQKIIGDTIKLFLWPDKSEFAHFLQEYNAYKAGETEDECWPYYKHGPKSFFQPSSNNKYSKDAEALYKRQEYNQEEDNTIEEVVEGIKAM